MEKFLKRYFVSFVLIMIITICGLTGCSGDGNIKLDPKNPVTIIIWHYYHGTQKSAFDDAVKEFNETLGYEKGVIVEAVSYGGVDELAANVKAAANGELDAGDMPDIFGSHGDTALEILNMGMAAEIDAYLTEEELAEYEESFIHEGKIGTDKLYVFPIAKSTESLMINKTDFDIFADGLEASELSETVSYSDLSTWEGILRVADIYYRYTDALTPDTDNDGKAFMGIESIANYIIVGSKQLGQDLVSVTDGNVTINLDEGVMSKLWNTYYETMVTGRFTKLGRFCSDDIKTGDSICYIGSTTSAGYFPMELQLENDELKNIEMMVLPMPVFENGDKVAISQGAGMVVAKSSKEKEYASVLFLNWFTEMERNMAFSLGSGYLPVKKKSLNEDLLNETFAAIEKEDIITKNTMEALMTGLEQLRDYTMYSSEVFDGGADFRDKLPTVLSEVVREDRKSYQELMKNGLSPEQAYSELLEQSNIKYDEWINSLKR